MLKLHFVANHTFQEIPLVKLNVGMLLTPWLQFYHHFGRMFVHIVPWSFDGKVAGSVTSTNCTNANNALKSAYYILPDDSKQYVDTRFIYYKLWQVAI